MNLQLTEAMTFPAMMKALSEKFPAYKLELKKNPIARFEYIQVRKTGWVGLWIRVFPKKNRVMLIKAIPSTFNRAMLGGLIALLLLSGKQGRLQKEIAEALKSQFNTTQL